jgi:hypothetical protein
VAFLAAKSSNEAVAYTGCFFIRKAAIQDLTEKPVPKGVGGASAF